MKKTALLSLLFLGFIGLIISCQQENDLLPIQRESSLQNKQADSKVADLSKFGEETCTSAGYQEETVDLTGDDLNREGSETIEEFFERLGFTKDLCEGECDGSKKCRVTSIEASKHCDITLEFSPQGKLKKVKVKKGVALNAVKIRLKAKCRCKK